MGRRECDGLSGGERLARGVGPSALLAGVSPRGTLVATACAVAFGALLLAPGPVSAGTALPDGRAWELVSPPEKDGASITPLGFGIQGPSGGLVQSSEGGDSVTYVADAPIEAEPEGNRAIEGTQVLAKRSASEWSSKDIVTPKSKGEGIKAGDPQEYRAFSLDLALGLLVPFGHLNRFQEPPLVPGQASEELGIYRRHNATCEAGPVGCFEPIVTSENVTGTEAGAKTAFGGQLEYIKATSDLSHVVLKTPVRLTESAPSEEAEGLYEWSAQKAPSEQLNFISLLPPNGKKNQVLPAGEARLGNDQEGGEYQSARNAISSDGRRVYWTGIKVLPGEHAVRYLFMRDTTSNTTLQVNAVEEGCTCKETKGVAAEETNRVHFQLASEDGSRVFFTSTEPLTSDSKLKPKKEGFKPVDLYVCEIVEKEEGKPACKLTDLTASFSGPGEVAGEVIGSSSDGASVYFVADGAPASGEKGGCRLPEAEEVPASAKCNLYVDHFNAGSQKWDEPTLITVLSEEDSPTWGGGIFAGQFLWALSSRVSPSGRYLAFMSNSPLTGYDNRDSNPAAGEAKDEEVFLYDATAATGPISCASCNPIPAQRPTGVLDQRFAGEGQNLRVDPAAVWTGKWLAGSIPAGWTPLNSANEPPYQSRYLLDNGRLFFNSADALVAEDTNRRSETIGETPTQVGVEDVYQYEPAGLGGCAGPAACVALLSSGTSEQESAFMDASASGNDAFLFTSQQLVSTDPDSTFDIYDAHACSAGSPCITPPAPPAPPCSDEASCRGGASGSPAFGSVGSEAIRGVSTAPKGQTLPSKTVSTPKPLTRAQKLARAMKACKKKYKHSKHKRAACERLAKKHFGHKATSHRKAGKK